ncbi:MAG: DUF6531 domain-containing protein, partial [Acidobacteria bacterium]|nr:DUF6531 domain-containing protein [Acidobacteriota bacterium]
VLRVYALDASRGILDLLVDPEPDPLLGEEALAGGDVFCARGANGMLFRSKGTVPPDDPRLHAMRAKFEALASRPPFGRFNSISTHRWRIEGSDNFPVVPGSTIGQRGTKADEAAERDYLLVAGNEYGVVVVEAPKKGFLDAQHLADVIWIPEGAASVRAIAGSQLATVVDGMGHLLLLDLSRIDERWNDAGAKIDANALFPTLAASLQKNGAYGTGLADPRIIWRSENPVASGTLAPLVDPELGLVYAGELLRKTLRVIAAIDPRLRIMIDLDGFLKEVGGIIPLGISQEGTGIIAPGALGAFRLELSLPGALAESIGGALRLAIESERVFGAVTEQTPDGFPRAHLRQLRPDGTPDPRAAAEFELRRLVPETLAAEFRHQRGYNRFVSPWIVAIADPRASEQYTWPDGTTAAQKAEAGCPNCERPEHLKNKSESAEGVFEIWSAGRQFVVRPELTVAGDYGYLEEGGRLAARIPTTIADTVRAPEVLVDANHPPVAQGMLQETVYVHSGELETGNVDLVARGRAGFDVLIDRTYRSRTIGMMPFGEGWSSSILRRLRPLPSGNVEYRDAAGETWLYRVIPESAIYQRPQGLPLALARTADGWTLTDQKQRRALFDQLGRLVADADEYAVADLFSGKGNVIRYLYDEGGRVERIVDPFGRTTTLTYWDGSIATKAGRLASVTDWRDRRVDYEYDAFGRLVRVDLAQVTIEGTLTRPKITYAYGDSVASFNDRVELAGNLRSITDPADFGLTPRVSFTYESAGTNRDRLVAESWATLETATYEYPAPDLSRATDALGQVREWTLTPPPVTAAGARVKTTKLTEKSIRVSAIPFGTVPTAVSAAVPETTTADRITEYTYDPATDGLRASERVGGVRETFSASRPRSMLAGWSRSSSTRARPR